MNNTANSMLTIKRHFNKETLIDGIPRQIECVEIGTQIFALSQGIIKTISLEDEWYDDIENPQAIIDILKSIPKLKADIFTFWQRLPCTEPKYDYYCECENLAVLPISTFDHWWNHQIKSRVRSLIRKTEKEGILIKETKFDDDFVLGMTSIFNESPIRQGRKFWHYGKDFDTVKKQFSRYQFREKMIGAYYQGQMIGFMMLCDAGNFSLTGQIIASLKHRDKPINNALISKAVEICANKKQDYLIYYFWGDDSLTEFKRRCGFENIRIPRYFVPLSWRGELAIKCGAHQGIKKILPHPFLKSLKEIRKKWLIAHHE
jgi:hypothetical protein